MTNDTPIPISPPVRRQHNASVPFAEAVDARMLVIMRCVLAFSALAIVFIDASEPRHWVDLTRVSLALYCVCSAIIAIGAARSGWPQPHRAQHWGDVFFYVYLVTLTGGASSIFFNFFLFSILVASFTRGFREGLLVTVVSLASYVAVSLTMEPENIDFELNRALLRAVYLFVFGYMISYWGGYESLLKRRLALLNEINNAWTPRFGVDHAIGLNLNRVLDFYDAQSCVLVIRRPGADCMMYRSLCDKPDAASQPLAMTEKACEPMLQLPDMLGAFYHAPERGWLRRWRGYTACDVVSGMRVREHLADCAGLANLLDAPAYVTVPYAQRNGVNGRLFVIRQHGGFDQPDIDFLAQVAAAVATVLENVTLMDELISRASEQERVKISRDLHDSTIQPYIGLKLALDALVREAGDENPLSKRLAEIDHMASMTIRDLRDYATTFKGKRSMAGEALVTAMRRKAERLRRFYGIEVALDVDLSELLDGRLASEMFHIVSEGLSNVLRHTKAKQAYVRILCGDSFLSIAIGNAAHGELPRFTPRSISARVKELGGTALVESDQDGYTVVRVSIPLSTSQSIPRLNTR